MVYPVGMSEEFGGGEGSISVGEAARYLGVAEGVARELADEDGRVRLEVVRERGGAAGVALELAGELARAREEVGRLSAQLREARETSQRLLRETKETTAERRRLTQEVMELRAAAEERLMLMERIDRIAQIEPELEEARAELEELRERGLLARILNLS